MNAVHGTTKVDGYVVLSKDWCMHPMRRINISKHCRVEFLNEHTFKGVSAASSNKVAVRIGFEHKFMAKGSQFEFDGLLVYPEESGNGAGDLAIKDQAKLTKIRKCFYAALVKAIKMNPGTLTAGNFLGTGCCDLQELPGMGDKRCKSCKGNGWVTIYEEDFAAIGFALQNELERLLDRCGCKLMSHEFGQSSKWECLKSFKLQRAEEVVIHVARDFEEDGKCILWKKLSGSDDLPTPVNTKKQIFCNYFLGQHCNTELDMGKTDEYLSKKQTFEVHAAHIKLYCSFLKEIHRMDKDRWKTSNVERSMCRVPGLLSKRAYTRGIRALEDILSWTNNLETLIEMAKDVGNIPARCEVIMCKLISDVQEPGVVVSTDSILDEFLRKFRNDYPDRVLKKQMSSFAFTDFMNQIEATIGAANNTLKPIVLSAMEKRKLGKFLEAIPMFADLQLAVVSEMVISFGIFGKMNYFNEIGRERFQTDSFRTLNLLESNQVASEIVFGGLSNVRHVETVTGQNGKMMLRYTGPSILTKHLMWDTFADEFDYDEERNKHQAPLIVWAFNKIYAKRNNLEDTLEEEIELVLPLFWKALREYAEKKVLGSDFEDKPAEYVLKEIKDIREDVRFANSKEFVERLFLHPEENEQIGLAYLVRELKILVGRTRIITRLADHIDEMLFLSKRLILIYPHVRVKNAKHTVILPFTGTDGDSYNSSSDQAYRRFQDLRLKKNLIAEFYLECYHIHTRRMHSMPLVVVKDVLQRMESGQLTRIPKTVDEVFLKFQENFFNVTFVLD